jgi:hypothetical protein
MTLKKFKLIADVADLCRPHMPAIRCVARVDVETDRTWYHWQSQMILAGH